MNIYQKAKINGCQLECTCVGINVQEHEKLMKGARKANRKKVINAAILTDAFDNSELRYELKRPHYNPFQHYITKTHIIYRNSGIEYFIKVY
jgi:hypothetical protein